VYRLNTPALSPVPFGRDLPQSVCGVTVAGEVYGTVLSHSAGKYSVHLTAGEVHNANL